MPLGGGLKPPSLRRERAHVEALDLVPRVLARSPSAHGTAGQVL